MDDDDELNKQCHDCGEDLDPVEQQGPGSVCEECEQKFNEQETP